MLVSAPFDDWWHNAYGLDVQIISPPHMVLAAGFFGIEFGTIMLLLAFMNRAGDDERPALQRLFLYVGGTVVCESLLLKLEYIARSDMHSALFYIVVSLGTLGILAAVAVASRQRWACTIMAARVHGVRRRISLDSAAHPGPAEARAGLPADHATSSRGNFRC